MANFYFETGEIFDLLTLMVTAYMVISVTIFLVAKCFPKLVLSRKTLKSPTRILLVIAHPDDECLFFGPTVLALLRQYRQHVYLMCLSTGDYEGKGLLRKQELWNSCQTMGMLPENIILVNHDYLRDDPEANWSHDLVGRIVLAHVMSHQIDTLITFDEKGVSGHKNHSAIYFGVEDLVRLGKLPPNFKPYALESVNIVRKYSPTFLDTPFSFVSSSIMYVTQGKENSLLKNAMEQHYSQSVWFRRLYLIFSRYLTVNTLRQIHSTKAKPAKRVK